MSARPPRPVRAAAIAVAVLGAWFCTSLRALEPSDRVAWLPAAALQSRDSVERALTDVTASGATTVVVPAAALDAEVATEVDGAAEVIRQAAARRLRVFAELKVGLVAPGGVLPAAREHVVYQHPEWLMVPREIATEMLAIDVRSPQYLGRLLRWTRANGARVDGLYLSPLHNEAAAYIAAGVQRLLRDYAFDGLHIETLPYPGADFDYSRQAMDALKREVRAGLSGPGRTQMDEVGAIDPFGYASEFPDAWRLLRRTRLTALTARIRSAVKAARPGAAVTVTLIDPDAAERDRLQDWRTWLDNGFVDAVARRTSPTGSLLFSADSVAPPAPPAAPAPAPAPVPTRGVAGS